MNAQQPMNALTPYYKEIVQFLVANSKREDSAGMGIDLMQASYVALTSVVQYSCTNSN